ncbi:DUF2180 family protein [Streptomyces sp. NPDC058864]
MDCFDCAQGSRRTTAIAVCHQCGAGLCEAHAHVGTVVIERLATMGKTTSQQPAREIACRPCHEAALSAYRP